MRGWEWIVEPKGGGSRPPGVDRPLYLKLVAERDQTASLSFLPGTNLTTLWALMVIFSPV